MECPKQGKKFRATISIDGERIYLGLFSEARDAATWRTTKQSSRINFHTKSFPDGMPIKDQLSDDDGYWM